MRGFADVIADILLLYGAPACAIQLRGEVLEIASFARERECVAAFLS